MNPESFGIISCPSKLHLILPPGSVFTNLFCSLEKALKIGVHFLEGMLTEKATA